MLQPARHHGQADKNEENADAAGNGDKRPARNHGGDA
jgi:hypothetical protein